MEKMVKSKNRPLSKDEILINKKQIEGIGKRNEWLRFQVAYYDLMLNTGLEQNYLKTLREYKQLRKEFDDEWRTNENVVKELGKQIAEGVEIKKISEVSVEEKEDSEKRERKYIG